MANKENQGGSSSQGGNRGNSSQMDSMSREELMQKAREMGINVRDNMSKDELVQIMRDGQK
jgi:hypothetical protein